jgi:hypothetical protein
MNLTSFSHNISQTIWDNLSLLIHILAFFPFKFLTIKMQVLKKKQIFNSTKYILL